MASLFQRGKHLVDSFNHEKQAINDFRHSIQGGFYQGSHMFDNIMAGASRGIPIIGQPYDESFSKSMGKAAFAQYLNKLLFVNQEAPDVSGYTFAFILPPDLSGLATVDPGAQPTVDAICKKSLFLAIEFVPPSISINTEEINTQSSVSMPYATTKVATGTLSIAFLDNANMDINSLHNVWIEYIYNQLWGDLEPAANYTDPESPDFGQLDYATSAFIVKYNPTLEDPPVMVGKATGIFPTALPVREVIGSRSNRELVMQNISYTCSYYEVVHPRSDIQIYSGSANRTIYDELIALSDVFR